MIQLDENEIGILKADQLSLEPANCLSQLKTLMAIDLIIDCRNKIIPSNLFQDIQKIIAQHKRCLVLIIETSQSHDLPNDSNIVPTLTEAEDFISVERMQRDLGF